MDGTSEAADGMLGCDGFQHFLCMRQLSNGCCRHGHGDDLLGADGCKIRPVEERLHGSRKG